MAYVNQEKKAILAAEVKKVMPKGWKYSLAVRNHSTIVLTISEAPVDLIAEVNAKRLEHSINTGKCYYPAEGHAQLYDRGLQSDLTDSLPILQRVADALNTGKHDNSDIQSDYFDVGHYVDMQVGKWNKPFRRTV